ncbi:hypothetical protein LTR48_001323 [Friedmanniomyces endolithicus]|uniref:Band 7 domain-containing protein n=1 Tax=Rachicladosporium monterosium TaxID=1507873 RepID=A0ABR0L808_9PEZI|nr:hypothetical protein LTR48_001323 [Friedmanniomyces endolithicus]KAK5144897.1 hypothetical protein LTR32_003254 [Rachicladosporium monterosium]
MGWGYYVAEPNSYLAVTGAHIDGVKIIKKCMVYPFQKVTKIAITPFDFSMSLQAMTSEKLQFELPAVFTIGPADDVASLMKYAVLLTGDSDGQPQGHSGTLGTGRNHVQDIVKGIIEGETRSIVSNMTMEELFNNRRLFKKEVLENVQKELDQFGLCIYNANVKELQDLGESKYFESLARKAHEGAQSQAQVDVAHARMIGKVGEAEKEGEAKQRIAKINAHTAVLETERKVEKANADQILKTREIEIARELNLEQIKAQRSAEQKDAELQKAVEQKRAEMELERLRATTVTQAQIARESAHQKAEADAFSQIKRADAKKYEQEAEAQAIAYRSQQDANAALYTSNKDAEAHLAAREKEAEAAYLWSEKQAQANYITKEREAEAMYIAKHKEAAGLSELAKAYGELAQVLGGPQGLLQYLMMQNGTFAELANANAKAINGLQPKINVWNTGSQDGSVDSMAPIRNLIQTLPPMLSTIQEQTGMTAPSWLMGQPSQAGQNGQASAEEKVAARKSLTNGHK